MKKLLKAALVFGSAAIVAVVLYNSEMRSRQLQKEGESRLEELDAALPEQAQSVKVYDRDGEELLTKATGETNLAAFVSAAKKMEDWTPNHPSFVREFYVVLCMENGQEYEFEVCFMQPSPSTVYLYGVRKEGNTTYYLYRKKSTALAEWLKKQVLGL